MGYQVCEINQLVIELLPCGYHVEVMLCVLAALQVPDEDVPVVAGRQDDAGVKGVRLQHKHLGLVALGRRRTLVWSQAALNELTRALTHFKDM